jgi:hypothetical protein
MGTPQGIHRILLMFGLALALTVHGCGQDNEATRDRDPVAAGAAASELAAPGIRNYAASAGLSPEQIVRGYVEALNKRAGRRFCGLVAPYISGRFEVAGRDPEGVFHGREGCPEIVSGFIGYIEDCCPPKFLSASVRELSIGSEQHGLVPVQLKLTIAQEDTATDRKKEQALDDTVWLARFRDGWRVAKLSAVAHAASLQGVAEGEDVLAPPDVAAETRRFARELEKYLKHLRTRRASYASAGKLADCSGGLVVKDDPDDLVDYRFPAPKTRPPLAGHLDLRSVTVRSRNGEVCLAYETAATAKGPADFDFNLRDSAAGTRFIQLFHIELRRDGSTRVTSGEDDDGHPIPVPARVGREGNRLTVVLDRASFATGKPSPTSTGRPPLAHFVFMAGVAGEVEGGRVLRDDLGRSRPQLQYGYPDGKVCGLASRKC